MAEPQTSHNVSLIREMLLRLRLRLSCSTYTRQGSHTHSWKLGVPSYGTRPGLKWGKRLSVESCLIWSITGYRVYKSGSYSHVIEFCNVP